MNMLRGVNPVAKVIGLALLTTPLLLSVDLVSASVVLTVTVLFSPLCGVGPGRLWRRSIPLVLGAPVGAVSMLLFGAPEGETIAQWGVVHITDNSVALAQAIFLRVLAVGVPVIVLCANIDATELGDGLSQILRLPPKFVVAAVAAVRLVGLLRDDFAALTRARRARGVADRKGPAYFISLSFGLLVGALRRGGKLATAMEARGFGRYTTRTWARESVLACRDWLLMVGCLVVSLGALSLSVALGSFRLLGVA